MALTLLVRSGDGKSVPRVTFDAPRIVVGRGDGCEVRLPDPSVSHRHASFRQRGTEYIVMDEGSTNGTFVGPVRLSPQAPRMLKSGDLVRVGRVWLEVCFEQAPPTQSGPMATREMALALVAQGLATEGAPAALRVQVVEGPGEGAELTLDSPTRVYVVGRLSTADLNLDDADLSRRHVELLRRGERVIVRDLGSKNGSKVGDRKLEPKEEIAWPRGESLTIGKSRLIYEDPVGEALEQLEQAPDERIKDSELIEPPNAGGGGDADLGIEPPSNAGAARRPPPEVVRPRRVAEAETWTGTDFVVALLAVIVLGLSVAGLLWLMRTG